MSENKNELKSLIQCTYFIDVLKASSHGTICSVCNSIFLHAILWNCSHSAIVVDAICNVFILESHITIAQNGYGTHSCAILHTQMYCSGTIWTVPLTPTQPIFYHSRIHKKIAPCERAFRMFRIKRLKEMGRWFKVQTLLNFSPDVRDLNLLLNR